MSRRITITAAFGAALMLAVPAWGKGQPPESQWQKALEARSEALNEKYGLGESPTNRALRLRGEALNEKFGLGAYPASTMLIEEARKQVSTGRVEFGAYPASTTLIEMARKQVSTGQVATPFRDAHERLPDSARVSTIAPDVFERAVQSKSTNSVGSTSVYRDAHERLPDSARVSTIAPDAFERAVDARGTGSVERFMANDNRFRVTPVGDPVTVGATGSGTDIEWPQIGIGLGIGIALVLGLMLALRVTRHRPLAH
jgi:hypothetical protein